MKKALLLSFFVCTSLCIGQITIDETYTVQELVEDILIGNPNFPSSNYGMSTGTNYGQVNGVSAFNKNATDFPFSGIVLSSGSVVHIVGPNMTTHSDGSSSWLGDGDLEVITNVGETKNASSLQFDFVPAVTQISLEFLMASEEYDQNFECSFADTFAFILTNNTTGISENMALIPNTSIPIKVTTVHPEVPGGCAAMNEEYFDTYNFLPFLPQEDALIDFNGQTATFLILGTLEIGDLYTLKIVIADALDSAFDSALFIRGSSFGAFPIMEDEPEDLYVSDGEQDGTAIFNLRANETLMLGDIDSTIYSFLFSYYISEEDAEEDINPISNSEAYQNIENPQTIYVRMQNAYTGTHIQNSFKIETDETLSFGDTLFAKLFSLYPNPAQDILNINSQEPVDSINIYSINGTLIKEISGSSINISELPTGLYFVKINIGANSVTKKFIKS